MNIEDDENILDECTCNNNEVIKLHTCPFKTEVKRDNDLCDCCDCCENQCADEI